MRGSKRRMQALDEQSQLLAAARIVEGAGGEIGQAKADQRAIELRQMRVPGAPPPAGVQQFLEVAADAGPQRIHRGRRGERPIRWFRGIGVDQPVEQRKLRPPGPREARALRRGAASAVAHAAAWKADLVHLEPGQGFLADQERHGAETARRPAFAGLLPVGGAAQPQGVRQRVGRARHRRVDRRQVDLAVGPAGDLHRRATPEEIARPLHGMKFKQHHPLRRNPEILARRGDDLEARRQQVVGVAHVVECPAAHGASGMTAHLLRLRGKLCRPPAHRRRAAPPRRPATRRWAAVGSPRNSGTRPSLNNCRRPSRRAAAGGTPPPRGPPSGSSSAQASRTTSARSMLPANTSSSASRTRAPISVGFLRTAALAAAIASARLPSRNSRPASLGRCGLG